VEPGSVKHDRATADADYVGEDFEVFYRREYRSVVKVALALSGSRWVAEELAQEAFVRVYRNWASIRVHDRPSAYLRRVAVNLALSRGRRITAEAKALVRFIGGARTEIGAVDGLDAEFWQAVRALPRRQAQVIALHYVDGLEPTAIAAVLGCDAATARVHLHRARKEVARRLGLTGGDEP
jgi:RNA polymerase sigma-70 factor (ECF subfamily)